jgi:transposase
LGDHVQQVTGGKDKLAWADQGYTGEQGKGDAAQNGIDFQVVKLPEAKKGFVLLPRRRVVERSFVWLARFRRLSRDFESPPEVLDGLHLLVFAMLMLPKVGVLLASRVSS